jgi:hypothetical protein
MPESDRSRPFLGEPTTFYKANPQVKDIRVEVDEQDRLSDYHSHQVLGQSGLPRTVRCGNPRCQQGGFDIRHVVYFMIEARETHGENSIRCPGHEGSPKGRRKGDPCGHLAKIKLSITYV